MMLRIALLLLAVCYTVAEKPGAKMRITQNGINYLNRVAQKLLYDTLRQLRIDNYDGSGGGASYSLWNIHAQSVTPLNSEMTLNPSLNGLTLNVRNFGANIYADYRAQKRILFLIKVSGGVNVDFRDVSLSLTLGFDLENDRPVLRSRGCSAGIGGLSLRFHGGSAWIMNLIKGLFEGKIRNFLRDQICRSVDKVINENAAAKLREMRVSTVIAENFVLDYGFVAPVSFTSSFMETQHRGEVYWKNDRQGTPYSPADIPEWTDNANMLYVWLTDYTALTLGYAAHTHGYLKYSITADTLPATSRHYLDTTCGDDICAGSIIPQIAESYPNAQLQIQITSAAPPEIRFNTSGINIAMSASVTVSTTTSNPVISGIVTLYISASASVNGQMIVGSVSNFRVGINNVNSTIESVDSTLLNQILEEASSFFIVPEMNRIAQSGVLLPLIDDIKLYNARVIYENGYMIVTTSTQYQDIE